MRRAWRFAARTILRQWVRVTIKPDNAVAEIGARARPVCYVLERESQSDLAVLSNICAAHHLPRPERRLVLARHPAVAAHFGIIRPVGTFRSSNARAPRTLVQLVAAAAADVQFDVDFVPVAIFWGRAPQRQASLWRLLFAEDWALVGRFRKFLTVIVNGRDCVVHFGEPVRLQDATASGMSPQRSIRWLLRTLRAILRGQRASTIGPDLSHRRTLVAQLLKTAAGRGAARRDMQARGVARRVALIRARQYALEISANYSQIFIRFMASALAWLWNRVFDGVEFAHVEKLNDIGEDRAEIIYVPSHRSHMDYLLLSYVIYRKGFAVPHVAAGFNLNLPVIGRYLRKGGAFFLRRSFKGDALYAAVFAKYLGIMMARGHALEYFIEGGRSRTGRLLSPRTGMLSMTVRAFLRDPKRPVVFMPVYIGYERIVEGRTYIGELSGRPKEKESVIGLVKSTVSVLRSKLGKVHVNLGEPIALDELLCRHLPDWRSSADADRDSRAPWIAEAVADLARRIQVEINAAAAVTPINLVAMAILATPRQALAEADLVPQLELYRRLLRNAPYSPLVTVTGDSGAEMIRYAQSMGMLERQSHALGDILRMNKENAALATYYRNNILHLFAIPSLLACCFVGNESMSTADIHRLVWRIYPYVRAELFLRWDECAVTEVVDTMLQTFAHLNLLQAVEDGSSWRRPGATSPESMRISVLAQAAIQTIERYYLAIALLLQAGSDAITQDVLEERCHLMAQRMSVLYGLSSPEFFDKSLFVDFLCLLRRRNVIHGAERGKIIFGEPLLAVAADAQRVLSEQIRHSILQVTLGK